MARKLRSDIKIGNLEKKLGLEPGSIRNPDGTDARSDKTLKTLRKEFEKAKGKKVKTNPAVSAESIAKASQAVKALSKKSSSKVSSKKELGKRGSKKGTSKSGKGKKKK